MLEVLLTLCAGIFAGTITGLIPGIHANLVAAVVVSLAAALSGTVSAQSLIIGLVALGITHSVLDVIPSIFLGAPDPSTVLSVLPGHRMLIEGYGYEAVKMALAGSLLGMLASVLVAPLIFIAFGFVDTVVKPYIFWILLLAVIHSFYKEKNGSTRFWAIFVFVMSGLLGITILGRVEQPLFPLLTGLFGVSALVLSLSEGTEYPKQRVTDMVRVSWWELIATVGAGSFAGMLGALLPGLGPAHTAAIAALLLGTMTAPRFLLLTGTIGTVNFGVSLITFSAVGKARNGVVASISELLPALSVEFMIVLLLAAVTTTALAVLFGLSLTKMLCNVFSRIRYQYVALSVIVFLLALSVVFTGPLGFLIVVVGTAIGVLPGLLGCAHHHAMGCLILPVMLFFL